MEEFVVCPICFAKLKEINTAHLNLHSLNVKSFSELYPETIRMSEKYKKNKSHYKNFTIEMSNKLKHSHTLQGYVEKYGQLEGTEKYNNSKINKSKSKTLQGYIKRYGVEDGEKKYKEDNKKKAVTLEKLIIKYGEIEGKKKYEKWISSKTLQAYIEKYGEKEGINKWFVKNKRQSESLRRIDVDKIDAYRLYCIDVDKYTRFSLARKGLENIEFRGKKYGYQLDHKISKLYGFINNIFPEIIGSIYNLEILSTSNNCSKQEKCSISIEELKEKINNENNK